MASATDWHQIRGRCEANFKVIPQNVLVIHMHVVATIEESHVCDKPCTYKKNEHEQEAQLLKIFLILNKPRV